MLGTFVNAGTVIIGSLLGFLFKKGIPEKVKSAVMIGISLCTMYIGISGSLSGENTIVVIFSIILGAIVGTLLNIDGGINRLGGWVENKFGAKDGQPVSLAQGFVTASLLFCIGAMTITGSLQSGLTGDHTIIFTKSVLDFISSIMLTATLGIGVIFSAAFVLVFQGAIVLLAEVLAPVLTTSAINDMTCVGSLLIIALSLNMLDITKIKVANYLPSIVFVPIVCKLAEVLSDIFNLYIQPLFG